MKEVEKRFGRLTMRMRAFVYVGWLPQAQTVHEADWA
jgi:hypothetical protein